MISVNSLQWLETVTQPRPSRTPRVRSRSRCLRCLNGPSLRSGGECKSCLVWVCELKRDFSDVLGVKRTNERKREREKNPKVPLALGIICNRKFAHSIIISILVRYENAPSQSGSLHTVHVLLNFYMIYTTYTRFIMC